MARNQVMRLLNRSDKGAASTSGSGGVLSRLWRQMLKDLGINIQRWNDNMYTFINDPRNGYPANKRDQQSARGNLTKEFSRPTMTLKVFMKALRFLGAKDVTIAIEVNYHNGKRSVHSTKVDLATSLPPTKNFMQDFRQEPSFQTEPVHIQAATQALQEELDVMPIYTELDDDASVRGLIYELSNPYAEPFEHFDENHTQGFEAGTEPFGGSYLGRRTYEQYLADTQQQVSNYEHRS
jgi:hypothetical protein